MVYLESASVPRFRRAKAPMPGALELRVHTISERIARARTLAAKRSPYRLSRVLVMTSAVRRGPLASRCMPAWSQQQISVTNSNGCAAPSRGLR